MGGSWRKTSQADRTGGAVALGGIPFCLFQEQQRGQCGQSRGNTRKEAKDATGAPSAWVSQAMMA